MNERQFNHALLDMIEEADHEPFRGSEVHTFREARIMTTNHGLVVKLADGSEFQITVVAS
jgi:hypothetical protein